MKTLVKIPRQLFDKARIDLKRPTKLAYERVGFFSTKCSSGQDRRVVHCIEYHSLDDSLYVRDKTVGVRIGPKAITDAMARSVNSSVGQMHVHLHAGSGLPDPSQTDSLEVPRLLTSLRNANAKEAHGWMILSEDDAWTELLLPNQKQTFKVSPVSIIGFPTQVNRRKLKTLLPFARNFSTTTGRYNRQSFLGENSEKIISESKIGVIGLCGGGSHVVLQLAHLGFKNFVLCDPDRIDDSNLNRLVGGTLADVKTHRLKVEIAQDIIYKLHHDASIIKHPTKWENVTGDLIECDLIIGCVDKFCIRRDLEAFCRRHMIPYIDLGMDVQRFDNRKHEIFGQVILSMPGHVCMKCMGFLTDKVLGKEAEKYGDAGGKPQVVWPNAIIAAAAVGIVIDLLTDWSGTLRQPVYRTFRGSQLILQPDQRLTGNLIQCPHFPLNQLGDPVFTPL